MQFARDDANLAYVYVDVYVDVCVDVYVDAANRFFGLLVGVTEPEAKRKIISAEFIRVFEEKARKVGDEIGFLAQGTIYPDILESDGVKAHLRLAHHPARREHRRRHDRRSSRNRLDRAEESHRPHRGRSPRYLPRDLRPDPETHRNHRVGIAGTGFRTRVLVLPNTA